MRAYTVLLVIIFITMTHSKGSVHIQYEAPAHHSMVLSALLYFVISKEVSKCSAWKQML